MKTYAAVHGDSGIQAYEYDAESITVVFKHGGAYRYPLKTVGRAHLAEMKRLADRGAELNTYINRHAEVREGYEREAFLDPTA